MRRGGDLAGIGARIGAALIDLIPVFVVTLVVSEAAAVSREDLSYVVVAAAILTSLLYAPVLLARSGAHNGQTLGKQALGIRVVRTDAEALTASTALLRELVGRGLLGLVPFYSVVDVLFPLADARRQALHDKLASTFVVRADAVPDLGPDAADAERSTAADAFGRRD